MAPSDLAVQSINVNTKRDNNNGRVVSSRRPAGNSKKLIGAPQYSKLSSKPWVYTSGELQTQGNQMQQVSSQN